MTKHDQGQDWSPVAPHESSRACNSTRSAAHKVVFVAFEGVSSLDISGPLSIFSGATFFLKAKGSPGYECVIATHDGGAVTTDLGAAFLSVAMCEVEQLSFDTVVIPGAMDMSWAIADTALHAWIAKF